MYPASATFDWYSLSPATLLANRSVRGANCVEEFRFLLYVFESLPKELAQKRPMPYESSVKVPPRTTFSPACPSENFCCPPNKKDLRGGTLIVGVRKKCAKSGCTTRGTELLTSRHYQQKLFSAIAMKSHLLLITLFGAFAWMLGPLEGFCKSSEEKEVLLCEVNDPFKQERLVWEQAFQSLVIIERVIIGAAILSCLCGTVACICCLKRRRVLIYTPVSATCKH